MAQTSSQPTGKTVKTPVQKFVEHFRVLKHSESYRFGIGKDSAIIYNHKIIFPPKLFIQLYSCNGIELHPVDFLVCGNRP
ncbi:ubiquitinyl hydrolase 1 [Salvia divinorum]|uniref:Ubiquitinyl hydrolase 1 n=1 Tax=Salvia divinorum TaxID=28513 RepID=A0ABD1IDR8_SALDI